MVVLLLLSSKVFCGHGGIGRRAGLRILSEFTRVEVRTLLAASALLIGEGAVIQLDWIAALFWQNLT